VAAAAAATYKSSLSELRALGRITGSRPKAPEIKAKDKNKIYSTKPSKLSEKKTPIFFV
jgi:hypothetical protein